uniref:RNA cytidine acetyltransferase n=1 Tax=Trichuris muris TaxID=70415 RepID=A0A5S6QZ49_TRIMR
MFVIVGDKGRDHVVVLHHILSKASLRPRPSVLWCYKKELGFTTHRKKRMRMLQKKMRAGKAGLDDEKPFDLFVASTQIRYCYYSETHKILGNTYGMCVLQDFEAITPNLLARTIETIEGGGLVVILLSSLTSLRQLYTMAMDVHARYRTEAHSDVVGRFNERFLLSLASCEACCVLDDDLNILPISSHMNTLKAVTPSDKERASSNELALKELLQSLSDSPQLRSLLRLCKTLDQAKVVLKLLNIVGENNLKYTVSLTAARGRGKSAALGLATAGAIGSGFSNLFVTSPSPENLKTYFQFVCRGFDALSFKEHMDYEVVQSTNAEFNKAIVRINVTRSHRQTIQYIHPTDANKLGQAELVIIDEAAAIPLVHVKRLLGPYLVFMASTVNGYEGTGRSLSLKLLHQLRQETACITAIHTGAASSSKESVITATSGRVLNELVLEESIRYGAGDPVESWINQLLCLDIALAPKVSSGCPAPSDCDLYPFSALPKLHSLVIVQAIFP